MQNLMKVLNLVLLVVVKQGEPPSPVHVQGLDADGTPGPEDTQQVPVPCDYSYAVVPGAHRAHAPYEEHQGAGRSPSRPTRASAAKKGYSASNEQAGTAAMVVSDDELHELLQLAQALPPHVHPGTTPRFCDCSRM